MVNVQSLNTDKTMQLNIVSAEEELFSGEVKYLIATGTMGELGIYPGHLQLLTILKPGKIRYEKPGNSQEVLYVSGGILEIQPDVITVLADTAMRAEDIDEVAAAEAKRRAEEILSHKGAKSKVNYQRALIEVAESTAKLRAIKELHKYTKH